MWQPLSDRCPSSEIKLCPELNRECQQMDCKFVFTLFWRSKFWLCSVVASYLAFAFDLVAAVAVQEEIALVIEHDALLFLCAVLLLAYL